MARCDKLVLLEAGESSTARGQIFTNESRSKDASDIQVAIVSVTSETRRKRVPSGAGIKRASAVKHLPPLDFSIAVTLITFYFF